MGIIKKIEQLCIKANNNVPHSYLNLSSTIYQVFIINFLSQLVNVNNRYSQI
jgi:hypothetical protein